MAINGLNLIEALKKLINNHTLVGYSFWEG